MGLFDLFRSKPSRLSETPRMPSSEGGATVQGTVLPTAPSSLSPTSNPSVGLPAPGKGPECKWSCDNGDFKYLGEMRRYKHVNNYGNEIDCVTRPGDIERLGGCITYLSDANVDTAEIEATAALIADYVLSDRDFGYFERVIAKKQVIIAVISAIIQQAKKALILNEIKARLGETIEEFKNLEVGNPDVYKPFYLQAKLDEADARRLQQMMEG